MNRRYISDWVPINKRLQASAGFVSASALGMAMGPAAAGFFEINKRFLGVTLSSNTLPGWVMAACWLVYLMLLWMGFKEPIREEVEEDAPPPFTSPGNGHAAGHEQRRLNRPLLEPSRDVHGADYEDPDNDGSDDMEKSKSPAKSLVEAYRLLTTPVKVSIQSESLVASMVS